jgi:hypothetical protein
VSEPKVVVLFKHEDRDEQDEAVGPVWLELVVERDAIDDEPGSQDVTTTTLGKLPWWITRTQARELADENGWFLVEDPPQDQPPPPAWRYDKHLESLQPVDVIESIAVPDGRVDIWRGDDRLLVSWTADDPSHSRPFWTFDPVAYGLQDESIDSVREWVQDRWLES